MSNWARETFLEFEFGKPQSLRFSPFETLRDWWWSPGVLSLESQFGEVKSITISSSWCLVSNLGLDIEFWVLNFGECDVSVSTSSDIRFRSEYMVIPFAASSDFCTSSLEESTCFGSGDVGADRIEWDEQDKDLSGLLRESSTEKHFLKNGNLFQFSKRLYLKFSERSLVELDKKSFPLKKLLCVEVKMLLCGTTPVKNNHSLVKALKF